MPSDINPIQARVLSPTFSLLLHDSWLCFTALQSLLRSLQTKRASAGVVVAPWDDRGWSTNHWGHLVYRAGLQSICLLLLHSLAQKIKQKKKRQKEEKKNPVCLARDYSDSSNAALRLPVLALWGYMCGCTKQPEKPEFTGVGGTRPLKHKGHQGGKGSFSEMALQHCQVQQEWIEGQPCSSPYLRHEKSIASS